MKWLENMKQAMGALSPSCREAVRLQSEAMDRPLSPARRLGLRIHLLLCKWCRRYGTQIQFLRTASQQMPEPANPPSATGLSTEARDRIRQMLEEARK
jgi:DNA-directed RNA polymerase specialized sigma24 family protein